MSKTWTVEFPAASIAQANDILRQIATPGSIPSSAEVEGRLGYMLVTSDYGEAERLASLMARRGQRSYLGAR